VDGDVGFGLKELLISEFEFFFGGIVLSVLSNILSKFSIIGSE
jgi:hypothetical protein